MTGFVLADGTLQEFKGGIMKILERTSQQGFSVPVIPMALTNLWGSFFSRVETGGAMVRPFRRGLFNRVGLNVGEAFAPGEVQPEAVTVMMPLFKPKVGCCTTLQSAVTPLTGVRVTEQVPVHPLASVTVTV